jgi:ABC-type iron transport system FetAB ATPase subunit
MAPTLTKDEIVRESKPFERTVITGPAQSNDSLVAKALSSLTPLERGWMGMGE